MMSETRPEQNKIFPLSEFKINGFNFIFRIYCDIISGGIILLFWEDVLATDRFGKITNGEI